MITARDGVEALGAFRARHSELACVILDWAMFRLGGKDALVAMRSLRADVPILVMSGHDDAEVQRRLGGTGVTEVLVKPFRMGEVAQSLRAVLASSAASVHTGP